MGISWLFQPALKPGGEVMAFPVDPAYRLYAATVTWVCPSQTPLLMVTRWEGFSSAEHSVSPGEQPIMNVSGGIHT